VCDASYPDFYKAFGDEQYDVINFGVALNELPIQVRSCQGQEIHCKFSQHLSRLKPNGLLIVPLADQNPQTMQTLMLLRRNATNDQFEIHRLRSGTHVALMMSSEEQLRGR
jgi:protein-L-isoaspartate O-methyltransferase